ncbi:MAG TPA: hypothetical protein VFE24_11610 [Pirellulales bacterium]|jgi:ActR/RegA family two-component response regulator|nr:hypothetical protein [Pirellulales bacterium]
MPHSFDSEPHTAVVSPPAPLTCRQLDHLPSDPARAAVGHYQCLVVSVQTARREMLLRAAAEGGWQTLYAADAATARRQLARMFVQLAIVDLDHAPEEDAGEFRRVLEDLSEMTGLLLVVCGNEETPLEEIWARQLGVWLYLPGVTEADEVALLCGEARQITEQIQAAQGARPMHDLPGNL